MNFNKMRMTREGFVDMGEGDKLILIESRIVAIVLGGFLIFQAGILPGIIIGVLTFLILPWLVGLISIVGWIFGILFSIIWAVVGYFLIGAIAGDSPLIGAIAAVGIFAISLFKHKVFSGLGYFSLKKLHLDAAQTTANNTNQLVNDVNRNNNVQTTNSVYCKHCGASVQCGISFCPKCGGKQ